MGLVLGTTYQTFATVVQDTVQNYQYNYYNTISYVQEYN